MAHPAQSFGLVALIFSLLCLPLIFSDNPGGYAHDETLYHLPAVRQIRAHWPYLDLNHDSLSATAPGYHYALATLSFVTGEGRRSLRLVTWGLSLALLWLLWQLFVPGDAMLGAWVVLPLACSNFFVKSASWIVTDNPALLGMAATLIGVFLDRHRRGWLLGGLAGATTFIRQLYLWLAVPIGLRAAWLDRGFGLRAGLLRLAPACLPLGVAGLLVYRWGGPVPPAWQGISSGGAASVMSFIYILSVFFFLGAFYYAAFPNARQADELRSGWAVAGGLFGLALALCTATDYNVPAGRWGGYLWWGAAHLPVVGRRSVFFLLLSPLGGMLLGAMFVRLRQDAGRIPALLWLCSYAAWATTFLFNRQVFQRYYEPTTLIFLILWARLLIPAGKANRSPRRGWLGAFAAAQIFITVLTTQDPAFGRSLMSSH
ncbi:MAG TPA: hypothetical protein VG838_00280 [Opitutaceae bacterium]|nr:hypothetical protein [Opitutaceae bacterium]